MFGSLGDMMGILGNLGKISKESEAITEELKQQRVEGLAGGEQVKVVLNGVGELHEVKIAPTLFATGDTEMVEELIKAAFASALTQSRELAQAQMGKLLEGLPLGPLKGLLGQ